MSASRGAHVTRDNNLDVVSSEEVDAGAARYLDHVLTIS